MFDPARDQGCPSCSFVADSIGHTAHLHARNTTLALVSRAPFERLDVLPAADELDTSVVLVCR
jgi:predicted dithiol-disulfide oxidoreductase (DUF899 family)